MKFQFEVENPNSIEVSAIVSMETKLGTIVEANNGDYTATIPPGQTHTFTFDFTSFSEGSFFSAYVKFESTEVEPSFLPSTTYTIIDNMALLPFEAIALSSDDSPNPLVSGNTFELDFTIGKGLHLTDFSNTKTPRENPFYPVQVSYPISYQGGKQNRVSYKLISGNNMAPQEGSALIIGQDSDVTLSIRDYQNTADQEWDGVRVGMEEVGTWSGGSQNGTFDIVAEIEVKNPDKDEWSVYNDRVFVSQTYNWKIIA
jgi:hypothetical protein